jgi:hypothetical protein
MKVKKYMCALLAAILFTSCFGTTVDAAVCATGRFTVTVQAGKEERAKTSFPLDVGEIVTINATYTPLDADVEFGLVDEQGTFHHSSGKNGSFSKSIGINERGNYAFAIRNNSDVDIEVTGYVNY